MIEDPLTADLILGTTLVDVKVYARPTPDDLSAWIDQVLKYALLDRDDAWALDGVAVYSGWHGTLLERPLPDLLAQLSGGSAVSLAREREEFAVVAAEYVGRAYSSRHGRMRPSLGR